MKMQNEITEQDIIEREKYLEDKERLKVDILGSFKFEDVMLLLTIITGTIAIIGILIKY